MVPLEKLPVKDLVEIFSAMDEQNSKIILNLVVHTRKTRPCTVNMVTVKVKVSLGLITRTLGRHEAQKNYGSTLT